MLWRRAALLAEAALDGTGDAGGDDHEGLDLRGEVAVHQRLLKLVLEVGDGAQPAHGGLGADGAGEVYDQPLERLDAHVGESLLGDGLAPEGDTLFNGKHQILRG